MRFACLVLVLLTWTGFGCSVEQLPDERGTESLLDPNATRCSKTTKTGCLQGEIAVAPNLTVANKGFFDANQLAADFKTLITTIKAGDGRLLTSSEVELTWISKLDNENFAEDFHVYLKGSGARDVKVQRSGKFAVNRLQAGFYDVRTQKEFKFRIKEIQTDTDLGDTEGDEVTSEEEESDDVVDEEGEGEGDEPTDADDDESEDEPEDEGATFCATLYSEDTVEIRRGTRTGTLVIDTFEANITPCSETSGDGVTLNL